MDIERMQLILYKKLMNRNKEKYFLINSLLTLICLIIIFINIYFLGEVFIILKLYFLEVIYNFKY